MTSCTHAAACRPWPRNNLKPLRHCRKLLGWTMDDLAARLEVSKVTVCKIENGVSFEFRSGVTMASALEFIRYALDVASERARIAATAVKPNQLRA